jgi:hypothetical protein
MLDRELLKRDPSAGRKLENTVLRNHETCPLEPTFRPLQPCLARSKGAKSAPRKLVPGYPG